MSLQDYALQKDTAEVCGPGCRQLSTDELVSEFMRTLAVHELTLVYIENFLAWQGEDFAGWLGSYPAYLWVDCAFIWPAEYSHDFVVLSRAWDNFIERGTHG